MRVEVGVGERIALVDVRQTSAGYCVTLGDTEWRVEACDLPSGGLHLLMDGRGREVLVARSREAFLVTVTGHTVRVTVREARERITRPPVTPSGPLSVTAPMPGRVIRVLVQLGQRVLANEAVVLMEAMKMENEIRTTRAGEVLAVHVREGQAVEMGSTLVTLA